VSIHPGQLTANPQQALWNAIGDLRREVRQLRENRVTAIQRASVYTVGPVGPYSATTTVGQLTFNLPDINSRVLFIPWVNATMSNNTSTWGISMKDDVDQTTPVILQTNTNNASALGYVPSTAPGSLWSFYGVEMNVFIPTPGDHTFTLAVTRTAGTATLTVNNVRFYGVVI
jgi:hypothetical protein